MKFLFEPKYYGIENPDVSEEELIRLMDKFNSEGKEPGTNQTKSVKTTDPSWTHSDTTSCESLETQSGSDCGVPMWEKTIMDVASLIAQGLPKDIRCTLKEDKAGKTGLSSTTSTKSWRPLPQAETNRPSPMNFARKSLRMLETSTIPRKVGEKRMDNNVGHHGEYDAKKPLMADNNPTPDIKETINRMRVKPTLVKKYLTSDSTVSDTTSNGSSEYLSSSSGSVWGVLKKYAKGLDARSLAIANDIKNVVLMPSSPESQIRVGTPQGQTREVIGSRRGEKWSTVWKTSRYNVPSEKRGQRLQVEEDVGHRDKYDAKSAGDNSTPTIKEINNRMEKTRTLVEKNAAINSNNNVTSSSDTLKNLYSSSGSVCRVPKKSAKGLDARARAIVPSFPESPICVDATQKRAIADGRCSRKNDKGSMLPKTSEGKIPSENSRCPVPTGTKRPSPKNFHKKSVETSRKVVAKSMDNNVGHRGENEVKRPQWDNATQIEKQLINQTDRLLSMPSSHGDHLRSLVAKIKPLTSKQRFQNKLNKTYGDNSPPPPPTPGQRRTSSYINRVAKQKETKRINEILTRKVLNVKSSIPKWQ